EDGIRDRNVTGVQTCALPISSSAEVTVRRGSDSSGASSTVISVVSGEGQRLGQKLAEMLRRSRCPGANRWAVASSGKSTVTGLRSEERRVGKEGSAGR